MEKLFAWNRLYSVSGFGYTVHGENFVSIQFFGNASQSVDSFLTFVKYQA